MKSFIFITTILFSFFISAQNVNIPDVNLKTILLNLADTNNDNEIQLSEAQNYLGTISVVYQDILDYTGIENFTSIEGFQLHLHNGNSSSSTIDLSQNLSLKNIYITDAESLQQLILPTDSSLLTHLTVTQTIIENLDVSSLTNLIKLDCSSNQISTLTLGNNNLLEELYCGGNPINSLNLSGLVSLKNINCSNSNLTSLNTSSNSLLERVYCQNNMINGNLDLSLNPAITFLRCYENNINNITFSQQNNLHWLHAGNNPINSIDLTNFNQLWHLTLGNTNINQIDLNNNPYLEYLVLSNNNLGTIDLSNNSNLVHLYLDNTQLSQIDLNQQTQLQILSVSNNNLSSLDLRNITVLNDFTSLNTINNPSLSCAYISNKNHTFVSLNKDSHTFLVETEVECQQALSNTEELLENTITIYPNPVNEMLTVTSNSPINNLVLIDSSGKIINKCNNCNSISVNKTAPGFYFLKINKQTKTIVKKIIIGH